MKSLRYLLASSIILILASCAHVGVGGTVSGGSSGHVHGGVGVGIHLLKEDDSSQ